MTPIRPSKNPRRKRARTRLRVGDELFYVMAQVAVRRVIELLGECAHVSETLKSGMHRAAAVAELAVGKAHHPIVAPVTAPHDSAMERVAALYAISFVRRLRTHRYEFFRQLRPNPFIGVQREDPPMPGDRDPTIALLANAAGTVRDDTRARSARERYRVVRGSAVDNDDVGGPVEVPD